MSQTDAETLSLIEGLLKEQRTFPPPEEFRRTAIIQDDAVYREAEADFEGFWARLADEFIEWFRKPDEAARVGLRRTAPGSPTAS